MQFRTGPEQSGCFADQHGDERQSAGCEYNGLRSHGEYHAVRHVQLDCESDRGFRNICGPGCADADALRPEYNCPLDPRLPHGTHRTYAGLE